jgi:hypothetical protein
MEIEIRYFDDCPNWRTTESLVADVLSDLGIDAEVSLVLVDSPDKAEQLQFQGSPTVMVNGVDPWANPDAPVGLSCRVYRTESGFSGSPSEAQLREAIGPAAN